METVEKSNKDCFGEFYFVQFEVCFPIMYKVKWLVSAVAQSLVLHQDAVL